MHPTNLSTWTPRQPGLGFPGAIVVARLKSCRMSVVEALARIRARIEAAAVAAGRDVREIDLLAVSKGQPPSAIREAYAAGQRRFGESYAQELVRKARELEDIADLEWHFIGHLQRNKVKEVTPRARVIETVDRIELAREIAKRAEHEIRVLIEVNVGGEEQKSGCAPGALFELLRETRGLPNLRVVGLMTIPPAVDDPQDARPFFAKLRELAREARAADLDPGPHLSMGMSHDFEAAIAEGATWVRVGTAIFGERPKREDG